MEYQDLVHATSLEMHLALRRIAVALHESPDVLDLVVTAELKELGYHVPRD